MTNFNSSELCLKRHRPDSQPSSMKRNPVSTILFATTVYRRRIRRWLKFLAVLAMLTTVSFVFINVSYVDPSMLVTMPCEMEVSVPTTLPENIFQPVQGTDVYVYSAYLDKRVKDDHKIRIIGIGPYTSSPVYCQLHYVNGSVISSPAKRVLILTEEEEANIHKFYLKPYFFFCDDTWGMSLKMVSLTYSPCGRPSNMLQVSTIDNSRHRRMDSAGLCLRTIYNHHSPYTIVEFLEMQRHLGVNHFYVYDVDNVSDPVMLVLHHYVNKGVLTIIPWKLPVKNSPDFNGEGQVASFAEQAINNDCIYRAMTDSNHEILLMHDLDEFIIPRRPNMYNIHHLLQIIHEHNNYNLQNTYASYTFYECVFCVEKSDLSETSQFLTLKRTSRHMCLKSEIDEFWWQDVIKLKNRQLATRKAVIHPNRVITMGAHAVITQIPSYKREFKIPTFFAALQHFKESTETRCQITDKTMVNKYEAYLKQRINKVCKELGLKLAK